MVDSTPMLSGNLSSEKTKGFISALQSIARIDIEKIILEFKTDKSLVINASNNVSSVFCNVKFDKCLFDGFEITQDFNYGISDLNDFIGLLGIFKNSDFNLSLSPQLMNISSNDNFLEYFGADPKRIRKSEGGELTGIPNLCKFKCDDTFTEFVSAINKISHENIVISGSQTDKTISVAIAHNNQQGNSFTKKIKSEVDTSFKVNFDKTHISKVLEAGSEITVYEPIMSIDKNEDLYKLLYWIAAIIPSKGIN